nr:citrate transporter [uncultured bacterium]
MLPAAQLVLWSLFILVSLINSGAILDQRRWIFYLEYIRIFIVMLSILVVYPNALATTAMISATMALLWYFRRIKTYYFRVLYQ